MNELKDNNSLNNQVLLIDDNPDQLTLIRLLLESKNYKVICANGSKEAFNCLEETEVDVIVCDVMMPDISGPEFIEKLRTSEKFANVPVIMITAGCNESEVDLLLSGADLLCNKKDMNRLLTSQIKLLLS
ncbi:MAG: response regulator [Deltaproteobacteria bacterium]|jgi:CheY-like chemotaxis protein|nr:response regulator [Deltaproteobacteria bacterium]